MNSKAILLASQHAFKIADMIRAKTNFTKEEKLREGLMVQAAIKGSAYQQREVAEMVGYESTAVSQWWNVDRPTRIPDQTFVHLAEILKFDPAEYRPWLLDMYKALDKIFSSNHKAVSGAALLQAALSSLTPYERRQLFQEFDLDKLKPR